MGENADVWDINRQKIGLATVIDLLEKDDPTNVALPILWARLEHIHDATDQLCDRFGIARDLADMPKWALIGYHLAAQEPEFRASRKRGRGRPSVRKPKLLDQADLVDFVHRLHPGLTDRQVIEMMKTVPNKHPSIEPLLRPTVDSILARVSEGRRIKRDQQD